MNTLGYIVGTLLVLIATVVLLVGLVLVVLRVDFVGILVPFTPIIKTPEQQLVLHPDGVMYTNKGIPFTGTSVFRGDVETYPQEVTAMRMGDYAPITTHEGKRIARYVDGLKEGKEQLYYTYRGSMFGMLGGPESVWTRLHAQTEYHKGLKDGLELINSGDERSVEAHYKAGVLDGVYREYHGIEIYRRHEFPNKIGPLKLETHYHNGHIEGWYSTYNSWGDTSEHYLVQQGKVIEGRINIEGDSTALWQWYRDGNLVEEREYDRRASYGNSTEPPSVGGTISGGLMREEFYDQGQVTEVRLYNLDNNRVYLYRKRINGTLIEIYNRDAGVNRIAEFGLD